MSSNALLGGSLAIWFKQRREIHTSKDMRRLLDPRRKKHPAAIVSYVSLVSSHLGIKTIKFGGNGQ
ncbi:hypothetical protein FRB98_000598 [Tulasnella sp. 332]|nr:hypothetical protein FRB98_000598 [Tulasnella sp. 332]